MSDLTAVSLFAGIGGIDRALELAGAKVTAAVEIDPDCRGVLRRHFPGTAIFNDVTEVTGDQLRATGFVPGRGILAGGWPCQGNSVAGRRGGMADPRSGLWQHVVRLLGELEPAWFLGENVPGLLSVNGGRDFKAVMDDLQKLRYVVSVDILDAQYFGVPQRRRRLFFACQRADHILRTRTPSSALTIAQCLTEILACILAVARQRSLTAYPSSTSEKWLSADGLRQRMQLFGLDASPTAWQQCLSHLADAPARSPHVPGTSVPASVNPGRNSPATVTSSSVGVLGGDRSSSTGLSWNATWAGISRLASACITSTKTSSITESQIYSCARALLSISEHIARLTDSSPNCWAAESSASIALKEYTNYARQAASSLFGDPDWIREWSDFIREAEHSDLFAGCLGDGPAPVQVLPEPKGGDRNPAARSQAGTGTAAAPRGSAVSALQGGGRRGHRIDAEGAAGGHLVPAVALPLVSGGNDRHDESQMTYIPVAMRGREGGSQIEAGEPGEPAFTVRTPGGGSSLPMVAGTIRSHVRPASTGPGAAVIAHALTAREGKGPDLDATSGFIVAASLTAGSAPGSGVRAPGRRREDDTNLVTHALTSEGADASEDGTGRGTPLVAVPVAWRGRGMEAGEENIANALRSAGDGHVGDQMGYVMTAAGFAENQRGEVVESAVSHQLTTGGGKPGQVYPAVRQESAVRRLTPLECERLQGFPDRWTLHQADGAEQSDSARYRQLGNSVAVPCVTWITHRLAAAERASQAEAETRGAA